MSTFKVLLHPQLFYLFIFLSLLLSNSRLLAQDSTDIKKYFTVLLSQYQQQKLNDTAYMNLVDSIADLSYNDDSLEQRLSTYQEIAFSNPDFGKYRINYYMHMRKHSDSKNRFGSAIYYSEKRNEERLQMGLYEKDEVQTSELFTFAIYICNKDYAKIFSRFTTLKPKIETMPESIRTGRKAANPESLSNAFGILDIVATAAWKTSDTAKLNETILLTERMMPGLDSQPEKHKDFIVYNHFIYHSMNLYRAILLKQDKEVRSLLAICLQEVLSEEFGEINSPQEYACDKYMEAFNYYFLRNEKDSAEKYLGLIHELIPVEGEFRNERLSFWLEGNSKLQAGYGRYSEAYTSLQEAYKMMTDAYYSVNADKDNNLYALAKADDIHNELLRTDAEKKKAEKFNMLLFVALGFLIFAATIWFLVNRSIQKRRLFDLQLNLARNFHDELGPMVLYAGVLLKKESETNPSPRLEEVKGQVRLIMETVRGISQDLKSNKFSTVNVFYNDISGLLKKIKASTQIDYAIEANLGGQILSHLQFNNLRKIVSEMITNSIKHADCSMIFINMRVEKNNFRISYSDNGKGLPPGSVADSNEFVLAGSDRHHYGNGTSRTAGIGIQNIRERIALMKGEFQLLNFYPAGYNIKLSIPLVE